MHDDDRWQAAMNRLDELNNRGREVFRMIERMTDALVNATAAEPTTQLRLRWLLEYHQAIHLEIRDLIATMQISVSW